MSSSSVNDALMRSDIDEEDWKEMDSLEAGSSSSSAYSNPLKSLVASFEVDSSNTKGNSNNICGLRYCEGAVTQHCRNTHQHVEN